MRITVKDSVLSFIKHYSSKKKSILILFGVAFLSIIAYYSRKRVNQRNSEKTISKSLISHTKNNEKFLDRRNSWSKEFSLRLFTKSTLQSFLNSLNSSLISHMKPLKDSHRTERRSLKKLDQDRYQKYLAESIENESKETETFLNSYLHENNVSRENFEDTLKLYENDPEIQLALESFNQEPSKSQYPAEKTAEQILQHELQSLQKGKTVQKKYILEDEIWETWGFEIGDVHKLASQSPALKPLYLEILSL